MKLTDSNLFKTKAYVDGQWIDADDGGTFAVTNPADDELIAEVARCGAAIDYEG
jgi:succinate-semialdehyde dehydrogenase/glutarate-semialdehyde dehydrogenase